MGRLARNSSHESLNDRGSTVYMTNTLPSKRRASQYATAARADRLGDKLRNLNYSDMYQAPEDDNIDKKLLKSPSKDSEGFNDLRQQLTDMGASIEKIVPAQKTRQERTIKGNSVSDLIGQYEEQEREGFEPFSKTSYTPKIKFNSSKFGLGVFYGNGVGV